MQTRNKREGHFIGWYKLPKRKAIRSHTIRKVSAVAAWIEIHQRCN